MQVQTPQDVWDSVPFFALYFCQHVLRKRYEARLGFQFIPGYSSVAGFSSDSCEGCCEPFSEDVDSLAFVFGSGSSLDLNR